MRQVMPTGVVGSGSPLPDAGATCCGIDEAPYDDKLYGRKNASWVEVVLPEPDTGGGGGEDLHTYRGRWASQAINFDSGIIDPMFMISHTGVGFAVVDMPDTGAGRTKALQFGNRGNDSWTSVYFEPNLAIAGTFGLRLKVSSEAGYDELVLWIDGVQRGKWSGEVPWTSVSYELGAGPHQIELVYNKDRSAGEGADTAWISQVELPAASIPAYLYGDIVLHGSRFYQCRVPDTQEVPGTGTQWLVFGAPNYKGALLYHTTNPTPNGTGIPASTVWKIPWTTAARNDGFWNAAVPTRFTIPNGVSKVRLTVQANTTGRTWLQIYKNNTDVYAGAGSSLLGTAGNGQAEMQRAQTAVLDVVPGDYFEAIIFHNLNGAMYTSIGSGLGITWFEIEVIE